MILIIVTDCPLCCSNSYSLRSVWLVGRVALLLEICLPPTHVLFLPTVCCVVDPELDSFVVRKVLIIEALVGNLIAGMLRADLCRTRVGSIRRLFCLNSVVSVVLTRLCALCLRIKLASLVVRVSRLVWEVGSCLFLVTIRLTLGSGCRSKHCSTDVTLWLLAPS